VPADQAAALVSNFGQFRDVGVPRWLKLPAMTVHILLDGSNSSLAKGGGTHDRQENYKFRAGCNYPQ
jgi:hypothetical protein